MQMPKVFIPAGSSDEHLREWAREAEDAGVDGCFVGDHAKMGLSTLLNTGTNVGVCANLLPSG